MGYGGHLMWTAVIRELEHAYPKKKITFASPPRLLDRLRGRLYRNRPESEIMINNSRLVKPDDLRFLDEVLYVDPTDPANSYLDDWDDERVTYKTGGHVVELLLQNFGIKPRSIQCELFFTADEEAKAIEAVRCLQPFIAIEPCTKGEFSRNKDWGFERWQEVADTLAQRYRLVQVGVAGGSVLDGVTDLTGRLTFRETAAVIALARLLLTSEGGLMHAANAVSTRAVVVFGGYISPDLTGYKANVNLFTPLDCAPCGLRKACPIDLKCMEAITPAAVVEAAETLLADPA